MSYRALPFVALVPVLALGSIAANAQLVNSGFFGGHFYEVYAANGISWTDADLAALALTHEGMDGYLATITTAEEDAFLESLRQTDGLSASQLWVGGFQDPECIPEPTCGWTWINGEGPFPGTNDEAGYANWAGGEPNDVGGIEDHLTIGRFGELSGWNDEGSAPGSIGGYVVEYSPPLTIPAADCTASAGGCETISGQTLILPQGFVPPGPTPTIQVEAFQFFDDPAFCALDPSPEPRTHFATDPLVIPAYLCAFREVDGAFEGRPYIVVKTTANFTIPQGTVLVINDTTETLPDNYDCAATDDDPQHRQVVVWQPTIGANAREHGPLASTIDPVLIGDASEYTIGCDSSRGAVRSGSYHVVGMSIFFGESYALNPSFVFDQFRELTRYKLVLLRDSVDAAKTAGAIKPLEHLALKAPVVLAIKLLDQGAYGAALLSTVVFNKLSLLVKYKVIPPANFNYSGEHQSRGQNIAFTLHEKIIPAAQ